MDAPKSAIKSERIAARIAALQGKLDEIKDKERQQVKAAAGKELQKAAKRSGLLALVRSGALTTERLEAEFRAVAERSRGSTREPEPVPHQESAAESTPPEEGEHKRWFGKR